MGDVINTYAKYSNGGDTYSGVKYTYYGAYLEVRKNDTDPSHKVDFVLIAKTYATPTDSAGHTVPANIAKATFTETNASAVSVSTPVYTIPAGRPSQYTVSNEQIIKTVTRTSANQTFTGRLKYDSNIGGEIGSGYVDITITVPALEPDPIEYYIKWNDSSVNARVTYTSNNTKYEISKTK